MKTTIEIADPLLRKAKQLAARDGTTLRDLVEQGLRHVVRERKQSENPFKLRDASVGGNGLTDEFKNATWDDYLGVIYGDPRIDRD